MQAVFGKAVVRRVVADLRLAAGLALWPGQLLCLSGSGDQVRSPPGPGAGQALAVRLRPVAMRSGRPRAAVSRYSVRQPAHYTLGFDDLDQGIAALARCRHQVVPNPYHNA